MFSFPLSLSGYQDYLFCVIQSLLAKVFLNTKDLFMTQNQDRLQLEGPLHFDQSLIYSFFSFAIFYCHYCLQLLDYFDLKIVHLM